MSHETRVSGRGPPRGGPDLRKRVTFSQIPTRVHADVADVRPRLPLLATPLALLSRRGSVKTRRPELLALKHEVVRRAGILATAAEDHRERGRKAWLMLAAREICTNL